MASVPSTMPTRSGTPIAMAIPAAAMLSLTVNGTPMQRPPALAARKSSVGLPGADGGALGVHLDHSVDRAPLTSVIRRRCASTTSCTDASRSAINLARPQP